VLPKIEYNTKSLANLASDISGLSVPRLNICIRGSNHEETTRDDLELGQALGVRSTPTILVNGENIANNYDEIVSSIRAALKKAGQ